MAAASSSVVAMPLAAAPWTDCRLCGSRLVPGRAAGGRTDDQARGLCAECQGRPEARRFGTAPSGPRAFTAADKALIKSVHGYMPAAQLLQILNDRLVADQGAAAPRYTLEQLRADVTTLVDPTAGTDWTGLRSLLAAARRSGLLATLTLQTLEDFGVVFQLTPAQLTHLKDVVRHAQEDRA